MKITFISQYFFPEQFSNTDITRHLHDAAHHDVHVITGVPNYPAGAFFPGYSNTKNREQYWNGLHISRSWTKARGTGALSLLLNYITFPITGGWTALRKTKARPDVSLVSMPSPVSQALVSIILKWRYGTPAVYWVQDIWPESALYTLKIKNPLIVKPLTWLCGWIYRRADLVLVQSAAFPAMIERFGVPAEKVRVFPNTAPDSYRPLPRDPDSFAGKLMPKTGFNLVFAGNIGESQDFDTYIEAAHLLRHREHLNWVIIGSGRDMGRVQQMLENRGLADAFYFLGRHPEEAMPDFFSHADAMLVGLKDNPIFRLTVPYKVQCYMACGRPIIASLNGEGSRIIDEAQAGITSPAQAARELALKIESMMDMSAENRAKFGRNGRAYFEKNYEAKKVYADLEKWLKLAAAS
ncbi:glycosyltransferase family 4 protein [Sulfitobacter geojensis]|uniref:glycosyltransferase family 4 protein n=1 Tax=Sulfitobacter geojensis TaxID=1342299 RepID=UPI00046A211A|nr:glycosyltransferase family 4 protein [Sulfitobacter geojensis]NYI27467.1 glycosyltransferase involved in cell wall biosynthesis [Sulfitobacter geojensis]